jgi:hypothetical protein
LQAEYLKLIKNTTDDMNENNNEHKVIKKVCNNAYLDSKEIDIENID